MYKIYIYFNLYSDLISNKSSVFIQPSHITHLSFLSLSLSPHFSLSNRLSVITIIDSLNASKNLPTFRSELPPIPFLLAHSERYLKILATSQQKLAAYILCRIQAINTKII